MPDPQIPPGYKIDDENATFAQRKLPPGYALDGVEASGRPINLNSVSEVAPYAGRAVATSLPAVGGIVGSLLGGGIDPLTAGAGAGLGSVVAQELRNEFPKLFGELQRDPTSFATQVATDAITEGAGPELLGRAGNAIVGAFSKYGKRAPIVATLANPIVQKLSPSVGEGIERARVGTLTREGETLGGPALAENINVRKVLDAGMKNGKVTDPEAMLKELRSPEHIFRISPESTSMIEELAKNAKIGGDTTDRVISYTKKRLVLGTAGALLGGSIGHVAEGAAGLVLTDAALGHLMSNPEMAKLVVLAMRTPKTASEAGFLQKALVNSLRAAEVPSQVPEQ